MHGMDACWFCREPVTEPDEVQEVALARAATASPPSMDVPAPAQAVAVLPPQTTSARADQTYVRSEPVRPAPVVSRPPQRSGSAARRRSPNRVRKRRVFLLALVLGVLAAAGAAAWEASSTRNVPPDARSIGFRSTALNDVGCTVSHPDDWTLEEAKRHATFLSDERNGDLSLRGFRITRTAFPMDEVNDQLVEQEDKFGTYEILSTERTTLDGRDAIRHVFLGDDLRFEQWWVRRDKRTTLRLDLWSRPADDIAPDVNERIVSSLNVT